jgi:hypothetical protein
MKPLQLTIAGFVLAAAMAPPVAQSHEIVVDLDAEGAAHDSVLDGFPSLASMDGIGDFGGNALGVALQNGVTEERAILEFPLASLAGKDVESATLTINIDDVVPTFGPGTGFDGKASDHIDVHVYAGDGEVTTEDFARTSLEAFATIDTSPHGVITDATLASTGPLFFDVDVTAALAAALEGEEDFLGFVLATGDNLSATSVDDLGPSAGGPPGVGGSMMPFLTIVLAEPATTTTTTTSTSTTSTSLEPYSFCGDASGDGKLAAGDALLVLRAAVGTGDCPLSVCDADGNDRLTATDAMRVLKVAVGGEASLVCNDR